VTIKRGHGAWHSGLSKLAKGERRYDSETPQKGMVYLNWFFGGGSTTEKRARLETNSKRQAVEGFGRQTNIKPKAEVGCKGGKKN